jgi:uncharacterized protein
MIGIVVQLAVSWLLIWLFEKKDLGVLGLWPTGRRLADFGLFFVVTALCAASGFLIRIYFAKETWAVNPALNFNLFLNGLWWNIKSVIFEELIFRGVLLYIMIKRLGTLKAIIISSIAFGIYHWFTFEILGNIPQMIFVFFITGIMGLIYAYGYAKTFSLYIPIAIHLGWNFIRNFVFSEGNIGNGVFIVTHQPIMKVSWTAWFIIIYFPMIAAIAVNFFLIRKHKQATA